MPEQKFLENVPNDKTFGFSNGKTAHNLEELYVIIKDSDSAMFHEHVDSQKNDFSNWIKYCIFHITLADKLSGLRDRDGFLKALGDEIAVLKGTVTQTAPQSETSSQTVQQQDATSQKAPTQEVPQASQATSGKETAPQSATPQTVAQQPSSPLPQASQDVPEEKFEFEDVFQSLSDDLEKDIMAEDS